MAARVILRAALIVFLSGFFLWSVPDCGASGSEEEGYGEALLGGELADWLHESIGGLMGWETGGSPLFRLKSPIAPPGSEAVGLIRDGFFFVFAFDRSAGTLRLLDGVAEAAVNDVKLWVVQEDGVVSVWSQYPYRASELVVDYRWENGSLVEISRTHQDPTREALNRQRERIRAGQFEQVQRPGELEILYPHFYEEYTGMAVFALQEAHRQALEQYRADHPQRAAEIMAWAFDYSFNADLSMRREGWEPADTTRAGFFTPETVIDYYLPPFESLSSKTIAWYLNDFAFFLAEAGDDAAAEPFLQQVIRLDPERTVAYINLGDVNWNLGRIDEARRYYREYLRLMADALSQVPERVQQRMEE